MNRFSNNQKHTKTMGLDSLVDEETGKAVSYKKYGSHEYNDILENWIDEFQSRFPEDVDIDFVEVSPALKKNAAEAYFKEHGDICYIRVSEKFINNAEDWKIRQVLLHAMTNVYMEQIGANEIDAGHAIKKWVCGQVGCMINAVDIESEEWKLLAEPFLEEDMRSNELFM